MAGKERYSKALSAALRRSVPKRAGRTWFMWATTRWSGNWWRKRRTTDGTTWPTLARTILFSQKLVVRDARWPLRKAVKEVKAQFQRGKPLSFAQLQRLFVPLNRKESLQLTDFIITTYNCIDYDAAIRFFDSPGDMLATLHATTGSEHDLNEVFVGKSDLPYVKMTNILLRENKWKDIHAILSLTTDEKFDLFLQLRTQTDALDEQIAKFLHMPLKKA